MNDAAMTMAGVQSEVLDWVYRIKYYIRDRLLKNIINNDTLSLIGVYADSGFGKTSLIHSFLSETGHKAVWYNLENVSGYGAAFISHLRKQIRLLTAGSKRQGEPDLFDDGYEEALSGLLEECRRHESSAEPVYIVIDNYHMAENDDKLNNMIDQLLNAGLFKTKLIIMSRSHPYRSFVRLKSKGRYLEYNPDDLRFDRDETEGFFNDYNGIGLKPHELYIIRDKLDGWVAGYMLVSDYLKRRRLGIERVEFFDNFMAGLGDVFTYLGEEAFLTERPGIQEFMLRSCILFNMDPDILDECLQRDDSAEILDSFCRHHKYTQTTGAGSYRYYSLFRNYLYHRAHEKEPETVKDMHRRFAAIFHEKKQFINAFSHALAAGSYEYAIAIISETIKNDSAHGFLHVVSGFIEQLSPVLRFTDTTLFLTMCIPGNLLSEFIIPLTEQIAVAGSRHDVEGQLNAGLRLSTILYVLGDVLTAAEGFEDAKRNAQVLRDETASAYCDIMIADCLHYQGKTQEALWYAKQALYTINHAGPDSVRWHAQENIVNIYISMGMYDEAGQTLRLEDVSVGDHAYKRYWYNNSMCRLCTVTGDLPEAVRHGVIAMEYARSNHIEYAMAQTSFILADAYIRSGDYEIAEAVLAEGYRAAAPYRYLRHNILIKQTEVYRKLTVTEKLQQKQQELLLLREQTGGLYGSSGAEDALCHEASGEDRGTDRITVHTLGTFEILRGEENVILKRKSSIALLQYLIINRDREVNRDVIIDEIFPEGSQSVNNFNVALSALRKALACDREKAKGDPVLRTEDRYRLNPDRISLDVEDFIRSVEKADKTGKTDIEGMLYAESLYKGDFLSEYPYLSFADMERERCRLAYKRLLKKLASFYQSTHETWKSAEYFEKIIALDPYDEESYKSYISVMLDWRAVYQARNMARRMMNLFEQDLGISVKKDLEKVFGEHRLIL